jgi:hypothetical protein
MAWIEHGLAVIGAVALVFLLALWAIDCFAKQLHLDR